MRRRKAKAALLAMGMVLVLGGCGSASDAAMSEVKSMSTMSVKTEESTAEVFYEDVAYVEEYAAEYETGSAGESSTAANVDENTAAQSAALEERKLIKTVDMSVETKEFDQTLDALENKIAELGGYIENLETYNGSSYSSYRSTRDANMTIRIPKQYLEEFLSTVEGISNVVRRSEYVEDVTLTYVDLESHKKVLQAEQERLLELMEQAEAIEDIITLENRLSTVRYQIESMESQLRTYDNKVDYSTVYLSIDEVKELTPVEEKTALERIGDGFMESLEDIGSGAAEFGIWFLIHIPYFVLWGILIAAAVLIFRLVRKVTGKPLGRKKKAQKDTDGKQDNNPSNLAE